MSSNNAAGSGRPIDFAALSAPFDADQVKWRVGHVQDKQAQETSAMVFPYVTTRAVMDRLDEVVGPDRWQDCFEECDSGRVICTISIKMDGGEWVSKSDGAGDTRADESSDAGKSNAMKGGMSQARKRAAVGWGIGRYLYEVGTVWADVQKRGKAHYVKPDEFRKLVAKLPGGGGSSKRRDDAPPSNDEMQPEDDGGNGVSEGNAGRMLFEAMKQRFSDGAKPPDIAKALDSIVLVDLALDKKPATLAGNYDAIMSRIAKWTADS